MSATNRGAIRRPHDFYATPEWCVHRLLEVVNLPGGDWLEPAVGDGAICRAVDEWRSDVRWVGVDVEDRGPPCEVRRFFRDYLKAGVNDIRSTRFDVAITNPPYSEAFGFVRQMRSDARIIALLLRLNWLEGEKRNTALRFDPPDVYVLPNRPSFTGNGTDACAYAWFVWGLTEGGHMRVLRTTPKSERQHRIDHSRSALSPEENAAEARRVIEQLRGGG